MTGAALLLGLLLAQGHGAKAGGKKAAAARGAVGVTQKRAPAPTAGGGAASSAGSSASASASASDRSTGGGGSDEGAKSGGGEASSAGGGGKNFKSKTYNFGAMDVEGKLKTPQLLYFLNRVKLELDMSAPDSRSFMKELEKSADDRNL